MRAVTIALLTFLGLTALSATAGCTASKPVDNPLTIDAREYKRMYKASIEVLRDEGFRPDRQDYRFGRVTTQPRDAPSVFEPWNRTNATAWHTANSTINAQRRQVTVFLDPVEDSSSAAAPRRVGDGAVGSRAGSSGEGVSRVRVDQADQADQAGHAGQAGQAGQAGRADQEVGPASDYELRVEVLIERRQTPVRHLSGSTATGRMLGHLNAPPAELSQRGIGARLWRPLGRDQALEQRLLRRIVRRSFDVETDSKGDSDTSPQTGLEPSPPTITSREPDLKNASDASRPTDPPRSTTDPSADRHRPINPIATEPGQHAGVAARPDES